MASTIYSKNNMNKSQIKDLQNNLIKAGYSVGKSGADGIWGKDTAAAVSAWKKSTGNGNTYGNSIGASNLAKLSGTNNKTTTTKTTNTGTTTSTNTNRNKGVMSAFGGSTLLGPTKNVIDYIRNNKNATVSDYKNALVSGLIEPLGSENITADPNIQSQWDTALSDANALYNTNAGQLGNVYNQGVSQANLTADEAARQQYIAYKQNQNKLAEQLSANGITGGASETALNQILNAYSSNLANTEAERQSALTDLANDYNGNLSSLMSQLQSNIAGINNQYGAMAQEDIANQKEQIRTGQINALTSYLEQMEQQAANKKQNAISSTNAKVQAKIEQVNPKYVYTTSDGRLHWTNSQAKANAAKATGAKVVERKDEKTTTKSSGSSTKSGSSKSGSSKSSGNSKTVSYKDIWNNTKNSSKSSGSSKTTTTQKTGQVAKNYTYTSVKKRGR